jgi:hypothetical protein
VGPRGAALGGQPHGRFVADRDLRVGSNQEHMRAWRNARRRTRGALQVICGDRGGRTQRGRQEWRECLSTKAQQAVFYQLGLSRIWANTAIPRGSFSLFAPAPTPLR